MKGWFLFFLFGSSIVASVALVCRHCETAILPLSACNDTRCVIDCRTKTCSVGLCSTTIEFNDTFGHTIHAYVLCQSGNQPALTYFSQRQLDGYCDIIDGKLICECGFDDCNHVISFPSRTSTTASTTVITEKANEGDGNLTIIIIGVVVAAAVVTLILLFVVCRNRLYQSRDKDTEYDRKLTANNRLSSDDASTDGVWDEETNKHSLSAHKYSSSIATQYSRGSRHNTSNYNDQLLPIKLEKTIGRGRFAEVWKGSLRQDDNHSQVVSVKVFQLRDYGAWRQEKEILTVDWMNHENIIEFYASEKRTIKGRLQYWLITDYYEKGSLAEYLRRETLDWSQFCDMAITIANGLAYLHADSDGAGRRKIPIAHRDMKSCNILVKSDCRSCVLADFGLSLKLDPVLSRDELANAGQVGTSRYMAPELLERLVNLTDIELFKRVDVYALALVYWEMANRCEAVQGMASPYSPPFGDQITDHPTKQQMLLLVCRDKQLPTIPDKWKSHKGLALFIDDILAEAWEYEPEARITARCIFERFCNIRDTDVIEDLDDEKTKLLEKAESVIENLTSEEVISSVV